MAQRNNHGTCTAGHRSITWGEFQQPMKLAYRFLTMMADAQREKGTHVQEAGYGHGRYGKLTIMNMPALFGSIGNLAWKTQKLLTKIAWDPASVKEILPEVGGVKRPQAVYRKSAMRDHGKAVKFMVDWVEVQAPALLIAPALAIAVQQQNKPKIVHSGHYVMRELLRRDVEGATNASAAILQSILKSGLILEGGEPKQCCGFLDSGRNLRCPQVASWKSAIVGSNLVYCSEACQAGGDDWLEETLILAAEEANETAKIEFRKPAVMYDYSIISKEAQSASSATGNSEENKLDPHNVKRVRNNNVYKAWSKGVDTYILFPMATVWRQTDYGVFFTTLADIISDVVVVHGLAPDVNQKNKKKQEKKLQFPDPNLQNRDYSNLFISLRLLDMVLRPKYDYFTTINTKIWSLEREQWEARWPTSQQNCNKRT
jgi:hypothetical protein